MCHHKGKVEWINLGIRWKKSRSYRRPILSSAVVTDGMTGYTSHIRCLVIFRHAGRNEQFQRLDQCERGCLTNPKTVYPTTATARNAICDAAWEQCSAVCAQQVGGAARRP